MKSIFHTSALALAVAIALMASSYAIAQELINPIPKGEEGKLTVEQMKSGAMPHWMPHYPKGVAEYKNYDFVVVAYSTDEENVTALLPEGLNSIDIPFCRDRRRSISFSPNTAKSTYSGPISRWS